MKNAEKLRIRRIKNNQKVAKTLKEAKEYADTLTVTGTELGMELVSRMTRRQLKHVLLLPERFEWAFLDADMKRLAESQLIDLHLALEEEL